MYCGKCGSENADNASFCKECGAPLNNAAFSQNAASSAKSAAKREKRRNRIVGITAVGIVAVIVIFLCIYLFKGTNYKTPVKKMMNAIEDIFNDNLKTIVDLIPEEVTDGMLQNDLVDESELSFLLDGLDFSYEISDGTSLRTSELRELQEQYDEFDIKIKSAKNVSVDITLRIGKEKETSTLDFNVIQIGRKWYIDFTSVDF